MERNWTPRTGLPRWDTSHTTIWNWWVQPKWVQITMHITTKNEMKEREKRQIVRMTQQSKYPKDEKLLGQLWISLNWEEY